jgi:hypothetical protein
VGLVRQSRCSTCERGSCFASRDDFYARLVALSQAFDAHIGLRLVDCLGVPLILAGEAAGAPFVVEVVEVNQLSSVPHALGTLQGVLEKRGRVPVLPWTFVHCNHAHARPDPLPRWYQHAIAWSDAVGGVEQYACLHACGGQNTSGRRPGCAGFSAPNRAVYLSDPGVCFFI